MWVTKLMISPVKKRIFCPKTTKFGPKLAFLVNLGQAMQVFSVPCWWVSWWLWRAGCISQDTYLLYLLDGQGGAWYFCPLLVYLDHHGKGQCGQCYRAQCLSWNVERGSDQCVRPLLAVIQVFEKSILNFEIKDQ